MRNSRFKFQFVIMQTGDQIESQTESFSAMPVAFAQNTKDLQSANHVFVLHSFACQRSIEFLFLFRQLMRFAVFQWQNHFRRVAVQAPVSQISSQFQIFAQWHATQPEQFVAVRPSFAKKRRRDSFRFFLNNDLGFQTVPLFLARIKSLLFFFGRWISLSVTSTIVYLIESLSSSRFCCPAERTLPIWLKYLQSAARAAKHSIRANSNLAPSGKACAIGAKTRASEGAGFQLINYFSCRAL